MYSIIFTARKRTLRRLCFYTCLSVILFKGGVLSQHALQVISQHALQQVSRGGSPCPHPMGKLRGIWSRPTAKGEVEGDLARGCLLWGGVCSGGLLAGVCSGGGTCSGGCLLQGGLLHGGCVRPSPPVTATAAGGTHPTGMHSC